MQTKPTTSKKIFFSGVMLLTLSTVLVKLIGLIYKIPMLSYLGSEGMGYFHSAYEIYALFCIIATAGLPTALSILISSALTNKKDREVESIWKTTLHVFLVIGMLGSLLMWGAARQICNWIKSDAAYECIIAISPTVFFICISSALRGYFQGHQRMFPTALSQLIESIGKLIFGILFARMALKSGAPTPTVAGAAGWGLTSGSALGMLYLVLEKLRTGKKKRSLEASQGDCNRAQIRRRLARLAVPMTLGASMVSLTKLIDMAMILRRLQSIGYTEISANEAYGSYTTLALSVFGLLPTLLNSVALPLLPMLAAAIAEQNREKEGKIVALSYRLTAIFSIPAAFGISAFAHPILMLLFGNEPQAVEIAAPLLSMLGVSVFLSSMITATNSVLHAYQIVTRPILSMLAGAVIKLTAAYFLIGTNGVGLYGAPISTFLCNTVIVICNLYFASRHAPDISFQALFLPPTLLSSASIGVAYGTYLWLLYAVGSGTVVTLGCIGLAVVLYLLLGCLFGVFREEDIMLLPMGERFCKLFHAVHLLPKH